MHTDPRTTERDEQSPVRAWLDRLDRIPPWAQFAIFIALVLLLALGQWLR